MFSVLAAAAMVVNATAGGARAAASTSQPATIVSGNFAGNGGADMAILGGNLTRVPVAVSNGDGTFSVKSPPLSVPDFRRCAAVPEVRTETGDFNGDGWTDIALVAGFVGWATVPVAFSNGDDTFTVTTSG